MRRSRWPLLLTVVPVVAAGLSLLTRPAAARGTTTTIVYDSFDGADYDLDEYLSRWNNGFGPGEMAIEDTRVFHGNSFSVSALPFHTATDSSVFDHIKYLALSNESFTVPAKGSVTFAASIDATTVGTDPNGRVIHGIYGPPGCDSRIRASAGGRSRLTPTGAADEL